MWYIFGMSSRQLNACGKMTTNYDIRQNCHVLITTKWMCEYHKHKHKLCYFNELMIDSSYRFENVCLPVFLDCSFYIVANEC